MSLHIQGSLTDSCLLAKVWDVVHLDPCEDSEAVYYLFDQLNSMVSQMPYKKEWDQQLSDLITSDDFIRHYVIFIKLLCDNGDRYIYSPGDPVTVSFILMQQMIADATDSLPSVIEKLCDFEAIPLLFRILNMPSLSFELCKDNDNIRILAHSTCIVLRNIIEHNPKMGDVYKRNGAVETFLKFFHPIYAESLLRCLRNRIATRETRMLSFQATCLSQLSFLLDSKEIDKLPNIVDLARLLLHGLEDCLNSTVDIASRLHGRAFLETLKVFTRLLKSRIVMKVLLDNNVLHIIEKGLKLIMEEKNSNEIRYNTDEVAGDILNFILHFLSQLDTKLSVFIWDIKKLLRSFNKGIWSQNCIQLTKDIEQFLNSIDKGPSPIYDFFPMICQNKFIYPSYGSHIFISHTYERNELATKIMNAIKGYGFDVRKSHEIEGPLYNSEDVLDNAVAIITLISPDFHETSQCKDELKFANLQDKFIVPICTEQVIQIPSWMKFVIPWDKFIYLENPSQIDLIVRKLIGVLTYFDIKPSANHESSVSHQNIVNEDCGPLLMTQVLSNKTGPIKGHIMISYTRTCSELANSLKNALEPSHKVWMYETDGNQGDCFIEDMSEAIANADAVIPILCSDFVYSLHCFHEIRFMLSENKLIIPIHFESNFDYPNWLEPLEPHVVPMYNDDMKISDVVQIITSRLRTN